MIGNAVPVRMAKILAKKILNDLSSLENTQTSKKHRVIVSNMNTELIT
jgi:hypothetical protein